MKTIKINSLKSFTNFYNQNIIENDYFYYPFSIINYKDLKSITSIGYQGIFIKREYNIEDLNKFLNLIDEFCKENNIITEFIRYNPYYENHKILENLIPIEKVNVFYSVKISNYNEYVANRPVRYRNALNKSNYLKLKINYNYKTSMIHNALKYKNEFFYNSNSLNKLIEKNLSLLFQAFINGKEIASSLFLIIDNISYYIANYSIESSKKFSANLFLLNEFYKYANENKIYFLGLGGGIKPNDSLSKFKEQFSTHIYPIYHSKIIRNTEKYAKIEEKNNYFPPYLKNINISSLIKS